jgi:hypothetical protein
MGKDENGLSTEDLIALYDQRVQDQSAIIFALVGKFGGEVTLTEEDLEVYSEFNTVSASGNEDQSLTLKLTHEDKSVIT